MVVVVESEINMLITVDLVDLDPNSEKKTRLQLGG